MKCLFALLICFIFSSCEKAIDFNLKASPPKLVVDATIENGMLPTVVLSTSLDYFSEINDSILEKSFVHNAIIDISDGTTTQRLSELQQIFQGDTLYYYTSLNPPHLQGSFNTTYSLNITVDSSHYSAMTTIPTVAKKIDSLWWQKSPDNDDSTEVILMARIIDPIGYGNYIRYFTSVNGNGFLAPLNSVYDDQITDGTTYSVQLENGVNRNQSIDLNDYSFFHRGDTVSVKFCNIDKATYDFWRTMEYDYQSIGNPFSSPTTVLGNISNGALGAFYGYASQYVSLIIPE